MNKETQMKWVQTQLKKKGKVTRNQALRQYISRLAARINDLREGGWNIVGKKEGNDYVYSLEV